MTGPMTGRDRLRHPPAVTPGDKTSVTRAPSRALVAPHMSHGIVARGINIGSQTRIRFADEPEANAACTVLARIEHMARIPTLSAKPSGPDRYRFNTVLKCDDETVFFDL